MKLTKNELIGLIQYTSEEIDLIDVTEQDAESILKDYLEAINYAHSSSQLNEDNHLFSKIKTLADLRELYPNKKSYRIARDGGLIHYFVNDEKVFTKHLIV